MPGALDDPRALALSSLAGLERISSVSKENVSVITLQLDFDIDLDAAVADIRHIFSKCGGNMGAPRAGP